MKHLMKKIKIYTRIDKYLVYHFMNNRKEWNELYEILI